MNNFRIVFLFIFFIHFGFNSTSQIITNPSFEGVWGTNHQPIGWTPCDSLSTPDLGPGTTNVFTYPSDGSTYLMMVTRGPLGPYANTFEDCQTQLTGALKVDHCYLYSIDLARSDSRGNDSWSGWLSYARPVIFRIWCAEDSCHRSSLLWQTDSIENTDWKSFKFSLHPTITDCNYLILDVFFDSYPTYFGNILIDNMKYLGESGTEIILMDTVVKKDDQINLYASSGAITYLWEPSNGLSCTTCPNPIATITENIIYHVTVGYSTGCYYQEEFKLDVDLFIPNIITPNSDSNNDFFSIKFLPDHSSLLIFNRWGERIYKSENYKNDWNAEGYSSDVYYYQLHIPNYPFVRTGYVTVLR